jgi:hypothetical protein
MKSMKSVVKLLTVSVVLVARAHGQAPETISGGPVENTATAKETSGTDASASGTANDASGTSTSERSGAGTALEYLFSRKPQDGSAAKEVEGIGKEIRNREVAADALGVARISDTDLLARFEEYLGLQAVPLERLQQYEAVHKKVLELLRDGRTPEAWKYLLVMSDFRDIDAGVSWELANRIETLWNADRTTSDLVRANDKLRQEIAGANRNADLMSDRIREADIDYIRRTKG